MKRRRIGGGSRPTVVQTRVRRPIDKQVKSVLKTQSNSQLTTTLYTTTYPGTLVGLRWEVSVNTTVAAIANFWWALVIVRQGLSAGTMAVGDGADFYTPEANLLAFGRCYNSATAGGDPNNLWSGATKAMRKLQAGDVVAFISNSDNVSAGAISGIIQFFVKS